MIDVAIIGAGPSGSNCAYNLSQKGINASLFDSSHPREKPCGGMLRSSVKDYFSILDKCPILHSEMRSMQLISPGQVKWTIDISKNKFLGFSRLRLDQYLLKKAVDEGTILIPDRVLGLERSVSSWRILTQNRSYEAKIVVGADGVNSLVRKKLLGALNKRDLGACYGYNLQGIQTDSLILKFLPESAGYLWVVPRGDHTNIGGGTAHLNRFPQLKNMVNRFIDSCYPEVKKISEWAALIPNIKNPNTLSSMAGPNCFLIGDAAGHVDPITGSGIGFAMLDGELVAEAIHSGDFTRYYKQWIKNYGRDLSFKTQTSKLIYKRPIMEFYCMYMKLVNNPPFV